MGTSDRPTIQEYNKAIWIIDMFKDSVGPEYQQVYNQARIIRDNYQRDQGGIWTNLPYGATGQYRIN